MIVQYILHFGVIVSEYWNVALARESKVPYLELHDANLIPAIAFGTGGNAPLPGERVRDIRLAVTLAIQVGYRHIDTAAIYGTEEEVGLGIRDAFDLRIITARKQLFITTKLWNNQHGRHQVVPALRKSLSKLGLDYVDLYLIHFPFSTKDNSAPDNIDYLETWEGMREAKALGLAVSIGVANFNKSQIYRLALFTSDTPAVNQIEVSPTNSEVGLVALCQSLGIVVMGTNPFGFMWPLNNLFLEELSIAHGKTHRQVLLRYLVDRGIIPVTRTTYPDEVKEFIDIFDFKISMAMHSFDQFNLDRRIVTMAAFKDYPNYPFRQASRYLFYNFFD